MTAPPGFLLFRMSKGRVRRLSWPTSLAEPVGCGALRPYADDIAEVKRMYTVPAWRGRGVAAAILAELERHARAFGYPTMRLETGDRQPGAIRLYERSGYRHIPPFGPYVAWADSVCFEKPMSPTALD